MAWTAPNTHATGDVLPASDWNTYVRDNMKYLHGDGAATIDVSAGSQIFKPYSISTGPATQAIGMAAGAFMAGGGGTPYAGSMAGATNMVFLSTVAGDASDWRFLLQADGKMLWGPGNAGRDTNLYRLSGNTLITDGAFVFGSGVLYVGSALDTILTRVVGGELALQSKLFEGNPAVTNVTVPATFTPNLATGLIQRVNVTAGGASTLTIGAPTNPPSGTQTSLLVVHIVNNGGGTITLTWNAAFTANAGSALALPTSRATATITEVLFVWDGSNWRLVAVG